MVNHAARAALVGLLMAILPGCLFESVLDANGGGVMTVSIRLGKSEDLAGVKAQMQSRAVKVTSAEFVSDGEASRGIYKLQFDDVTKLTTSQFFHSLTITRSEGASGAQVLTAVAKNQHPTEVPDTVVQRLGKDVKVVVTFPGEVIESNGTVSGGNTVTWTWGMKEFYRQAELMMTTAYRRPAATPGTPGPK